MKIWVDDIRTPPSNEWVWVKTVYIAKEYIMGMYSLIELISLDHDAGDYAPYGGDYIEILNIMEMLEYALDIKFNIPIHIHSMNPVGVANMRAIIQRNGWKEI